MFDQRADAICRQIEAGRAVLVLGAGATASCLDERGHNLKTAGPLAAHMAHVAGLPYDNDSLPDVYAAAEHVLGTERTNEILISAYSNCRASRELEDLFRFAWRRVYTFNVDDAIESVPKRSRVQEFRIKNALKDRVSESQGIGYCEIIHLNGSVSDPHSGFVFSAEEYAQKFSQIPPWYSKVGDDYLDHTVFFIGTALNEPLLASQIERAKSAAGGKAGISYLIVPDKISEIRRQALEANKIIHIQGTLDDFVRFLLNKFPDGVRPQNILETSSGLVPKDADALSAKDLSALHAFRPIDAAGMVQRTRRNADRRDSLGKQFFGGFPPSWDILSASTYIKLGAYKKIVDDLTRPPTTQPQLYVVLGDSGAGKTTGLMHAISERLKRDSKDFVLEYIDTGKALIESCHVLSKFYRDRQITIFIEPLAIYVEDVFAVLQNGGFRNLRFVASARTGEWNDRISKRLQSYAEIYDIPRFDEGDVSSIISGLDNFLPAPSFAKLGREEKVQRIKSARKQLLMLFKEIGGGALFDQIIEDEYRNITTHEDRITFLAVGVASLARVGLPFSAARSVKRGAGSVENLEATLERLGTTVNVYGDRIFARHELYVRHIIDRVADKTDLYDAIRLIGMYFAQYEAPVARHVTRKEFQLFKYVLNEDNLRRLFSEKGEEHFVESLFREFEIPFQRDGHFWLQYGLYKRSIGENAEALPLLMKSCDAFPENDYARHALAQQKLMLAASMPRSNKAQAYQWADEAVSELMQQDARQLDLDEDSAIWTLAKYHTRFLRHWSEHEKAKDNAKRYFDRLNNIKGRMDDRKISAARGAMLLLATTGQYQDF